MMYAWIYVTGLDARVARVASAGDIVKHRGLAQVLYSLQKPSVSVVVAGMGSAMVRWRGRPTYDRPTTDLSSLMGSVSALGATMR